MADNVAITPGAGATVATDDVGGFHYQRVKLAQGADGSATDVSSAAPLYAQVSDGSNVVAIKAASTAPVAADKAMVVSISPNSINGNGRAAAASSAPVVLSTEDLAAISGPQIASLNSASVYAGTTALTPAWAVIAASSSGANSIKAADATKKIRVLAWDLSPSAAVNAKWQSASTDKTGLYYMGGAGNGQRAGFNIAGWFETAANEALNLNLSSAVPVGGVVCYVLV